MNPKTTLLLFFLVLLLGAGIVGVERWLPTTKARLEADAKALRFDEKALDHIEMRFGDGRSFVLVRQAGVWRATQPMDDVVDPERVGRLMKELAGMELVERVKQEEFDKKAWKATGLDEPVAKFRLMAGEKTLVEFWLGQPGTLENMAYASLPPGEGDKVRQLFMLRSGLHEVIKESPMVWRDLKLLRMPAEEVTLIKLSTEAGEIEVARGQGGREPWDLVKPLQTRASKERVDELLAVVLNLEITSAELDVVATNPGTTPAGGNPVPGEMKVVIAGAGARYEVTLSKPKEAGAKETEAQVSHRRPQFRVSAGQIGLLWCEPNSLRDDHLARVDAESVEGFGIRSETFPEVSLKQEKQSWLVQRQGRWEPANGDRVARFFEMLKETRFREFTSDSAAELAPYGLDNPFMTLWWREQGSTQNTELVFGQNVEGTAFYVKYTHEPFIYRISAEVLPQIPPDVLKWKGRGVLRFSQFDLKRITLSIGAAPPVVLNYDAMTAQWKGQVGDQDVTSLIDRVKADAFAGALGRLNGDDWSSALAEALQALKKPTVRIQVVLQQAGRQDAPEKVEDLQFAPTQPGQDTAIYYGRLGESPDVFYITRESLRKLLTPIFKDGVARQ
jgi:hypothetical protein